MVAYLLASHSTWQTVGKGKIRKDRTYAFRNIDSVFPIGQLDC